MNIADYFRSTKALLAVSGVIELAAGVALLVRPSPTVMQLVGESLESPGALSVARVGGAGLLALGLTCWLARVDAQSRAATGLVAAMLTYNVAAAAILAHANIGYGLRGVALWPGVALHAVLAVWCAARQRKI